MSKIPAPAWIKVLIVLVAFAALVLVCFQWLFPWAQIAFHLTDNTVN
ncbi:MAG: hypothetical protein E7A62_08995 [Actinomycetaceae bacterium]|nr:hypothetical protein [Actinomycetaceae bacterium]MDU0971107.1 hypothetical protein [Actinomycetaceae bacterium]